MSNVTDVTDDDLSTRLGQWPFYDVIFEGVKDLKMRTPDSVQLDDARIARRQTKKLDKQHVPCRQSHGQKKVSLFRHLVQYERDACLTYGLE